MLDRVRALNEIAKARGQKLAQLALQWALRDPRVTSAVIGASSVAQLDTNLDALDGPPLTDEMVRAADAVITMGCGDECPMVVAERRVEWQIPDPKNMPPEEFRAVRDQIESKVVDLLAAL